MAEVARTPGNQPEVIVARPRLAAYLTRYRDHLFAGAGGSDRLLTRDHRIAGHPICLRFAGPEVESQLGAALRPRLSASVHVPVLEAIVTHAVEGGTDFPPPDWTGLRYWERGSLRAYQDERFSLVYNRKSNAFSAVDFQEGTGLHWTRTAEFPFHERATPLRHLLQPTLQRLGLVLVHAAAVGRPDGGVLIAGRSGSGKSTTALACLGAEDLLYAGDDLILVEAGPNPHVHALYDTLRMNPSTLRRFPAWESRASNPSSLATEKALLFLSSARPEKLCAGFPLRAIVLPRVVPEARTRTLSLPSIEAFKSIVPDTLLSILGDSSGLMRTLKELIQGLPCYRLELGTDFDRIPEAIVSLLDR